MHNDVDDVMIKIENTTMLMMLIAAAALQINFYHYTNAMITSNLSASILIVK